MVSFAIASMVVCMPLLFCPLLAVGLCLFFLIVPLPVSYPVIPCCLMVMVSVGS